MYSEPGGITIPFKIVRNDITKMNTEAIVNTASDRLTVGAGCDSAVYKAAGYEELLAYQIDFLSFDIVGKFWISEGGGNADRGGFDWKQTGYLSSKQSN